MNTIAVRNVQMKERSLYSSSACITIMGIYLAFHDGALSIKSRTLSRRLNVICPSRLYWPGCELPSTRLAGLILECDRNWYLFCIRSHRCIGASSVLYLSLFYLLLYTVGRIYESIRCDCVCVCVWVAVPIPCSPHSHTHTREQRKKIFILRPKSRFNVFSFIQFNLVRRLQRLRTCLIKYYLRDIPVPAHAFRENFFFSSHIDESAII